MRNLPFSHDIAIPYDIPHAALLIASDSLTCCPSVENLQTELLSKFSKIIIDAQALHHRHLDALKGRASATEAAFKDLDPEKDQQLFIEHNTGQFSIPPDWGFEPCATHYDTVRLLSH